MPAGCATTMWKLPSDWLADALWYRRCLPWFTKHFARSVLASFVTMRSSSFFLAFCCRLCVCVPLENGTQLPTSDTDNNTENNWTASYSMHPRTLQPNGKGKKNEFSHRKSKQFLQLSLFISLNVFSALLFLSRYLPFAIHSLRSSLDSTPLFPVFILFEMTTLTRFRYKNFLVAFVRQTRFFSVLSVGVIFFIQFRRRLSLCRLHSLIL